MPGRSSTAGRRGIYAVVYGGAALVAAIFGMVWWSTEGDPVLGVFFLILAALSVGCYFLLTQPIRVRARRDAERAATSTATEAESSTPTNWMEETGPAARQPAALGTESGEILIERPKGYYYAVFRRYRILIDDEPAGTLKKGETLRATVPPGRHNVVAKIDWSGSRSLEVDVPSGGRVALDVEPSGDAFSGVFSSDRALTLTVKPEKPKRGVQPTE